MEVSERRRKEVQTSWRKRMLIKSRKLMSLSMIHFWPTKRIWQLRILQFAVARVSTVTKEHTLIDESLPSSIVSGSVALESATLGVKTPEIQVEKIEDQKGMEHDFSQAVVGVHSIASPQVVDDTRVALEHEYNGLLQKPLEYSIFTENKREEIHTFYGSNHASADVRITIDPAVSESVRIYSFSSFGLLQVVDEVFVEMPQRIYLFTTL